MIGTDLNFWIFILSVLPLVLTTVLFVALLIHIEKKNGTATVKGWHVWLAAFSVIPFMTWITLGSYGPGTAPDLPDALEEGVNQRMADVPAEDTDAAAASAESKVPDVLKRVRKNAQGGSGPERIDEDEKFRRTMRKYNQIQQLKGF